MGWDRMSLDPTRLKKHFQNMMTVPGAALRVSFGQHSVDAPILIMPRYCHALAYLKPGNCCQYLRRPWTLRLEETFWYCQK